MKSLVSVVIPVYNAESTIVGTIDSVLNQTYKNLEIILVDDGSKDNSNKIMADYIENHKDANIKLITKKNGGVSSARNAGIDNSTGDYIAFLDSDDQWVPTKTELQLSVMQENPHIDLLGSNMNDVVIKRWFDVTFTRLTKITPRMILLKNFLSIQTTITKTSVIKEIGYFYEDQDNEDSNIVIRIGHRFNIYLLNEPLVIYGNGKPFFGFSGLNARLWEMEKGELKNVSMALKMKIINHLEYPFFAGFSLAKYFRRVVIKFFMNKNDN